MQRVKKEFAKRLEQLIEVNLNDENLLKAINSRVIQETRIPWKAGE